MFALKTTVCILIWVFFTWGWYKGIAQGYGNHVAGRLILPFVVFSTVVELSGLFIEYRMQNRLEDLTPQYQWTI